MVVSNSSEIDQILNSFTSRPDGLPGVVCRAVKKDGTLLYEGVSGVKGLNEKQPITPDTVFWIASFTKLLTIVGAMQLVEQGKISLEEPAEKFVPQLAQFKVLEGFDANDKPILRAPTTKITLRHLLTHTSGHTYDFFNPNSNKYAQQNHFSKSFSTKLDTISLPLSFEPGTKWEYGVAIDWVGKVIEAISGQTLDEYLKKNLFHPLGMNSTTFLATEEMMKRHVRLHTRNADGSLAEREDEIVPASQVEVHIGGAGVHSIAADYCAVLQALANGGVGQNGQRILKSETVDRMFEDDTTPRGIPIEGVIPNPIPYLSNPVNMSDGVKKGWCFAGLKTHDPLPSGRSAGSVWWAGICNTYWWIDRTKGVVGVILTQILPFADAEVFKCWGAYEKKIYEALN